MALALKKLALEICHLARSIVLMLRADTVVLMSIVAPTSAQQTLNTKHQAPNNNKWPRDSKWQINLMGLVLSLIALIGSIELIAGNQSVSSVSRWPERSNTNKSNTNGDTREWFNLGVTFGNSFSLFDCLMK